MASSANFILKAYATEQNARDDTNPLAVNSLSAEAGSIINNPSQAANYGYWAFQRYWYRIESNEPVTEFYIDWDDGEDNSPSKANVSIIKNDKPSFYGITSHIYTQAKKFYPLIRVKSVEGFLSKWYTPHAGSGSSVLNTFTGLDDDLKTTASLGEIYDSGQNSFSVVSVERNSKTAKATITITAFGQLNTGDKVNLVATDGTNYDFTCGDQSSVNGTWESTTSNNATATNLMNVINTSSGPAGTRFTATVTTNVVTVTQAVAGRSGNTTVTLTDSGTVGMTKTNFVFTEGAGVGAFARIPVFEPANVPPIGVLKTDRKRLFSNIDNDLISKDGRLLNGITPYGALPSNDTVTLWCDNSARELVQVKVTYQEAIVGGVKAVASIQIVAKGPDGAGGQFYNRDLDDAAIFIKTMDAHYCCFWNADNRQTSGTAIPGFNPDLHTEVIATPSGAGGNTGIVTVQQVVISMVNALNGVKFPASTGRTEFTATGTDDGDVEQITITNLREGNPSEEPAWITLQNCTAGNHPMEMAGGYGTSGVRTNGTGEGAGVSPSGGNIKQKTLTNTVDKTGTDAKIETVERILKVELLNNLEATDSYGGTSQPDRLYPGEKAYLLTSIENHLTNLPAIPDRRNIDTNIHNTVCYVSLGSPIVDLNSLGGHAMVDASESKIRCSNKSLAYYYFDDNKLISGDNVESDGDTDGDAMSIQNHQEADTTDASFGITDKLVDGVSQKTTVSAKELRYSHEWWREHTDSNYRFYPQKRLIRCQVDDDHTQIADDSFSRSPIEHWDYSGYLKASAAGNDDNNQPLEISKYNYGAFLFTNKAQARAPNWKNLNETNRADKFPIFHCAPSSVNSTVYKNQLLASTSFDTQVDFSAASDHYAPDNRTVAMAVGSTSYDDNPDSVAIGPRNALFMAKKEKYDRIFVRVSHDLYTATDQISTANLIQPAITNNPTPGTTTGMPKVRLQILYPAKKTSVVGSSEDKVVWKALPYIDGTSLKGKDDSTFYTSGDISFTAPSDWVKTSHSTMNPIAATDTNIIYPFEDNFFEDGSGTTGINDAWTEDSYALIFLITVITQGAEATKNCFSITSMYPYNNSHSQLVEIVDPTHVSLNRFGIAQSVSFVRKGTYQEIKDRSGISQMRRIGASAGGIKLGGIDLKGDVQTTRAKFHEFQQDAVPVYYDVTHRDNSITRLFGILTEMSEDHPAGNVIPKFACKMTVTHILELDSSGNILDNGYLPLGGDVIDVGQYLSAA